MEIKPQKYRLALVFSSLFFPFTFPDVLESLRKRGYTIPQLPQPIPAGPRAYLGGYVAVKEDCAVELNPDRHLIAVEASSNRTAKIMQELITMAVSDFYINMEEEIDYLELTSNYIVVSDKNPFESIRKFRSESFNEFNEILGTETTLYEISIVPNESLPNSKNWFDIRIEPRFTMPNHAYYIAIVYRNENPEKVLNFSQEVDSKISFLIKTIEET